MPRNPLLSRADLNRSLHKRLYLFYNILDYVALALEMMLFESIALSVNQSISQTNLIAVFDEVEKISAEDFQGRNGRVKTDPQKQSH